MSNVGSFLCARVGTFGDRVAVVEGESSVSFTALEGLIACVRSSLPPGSPGHPIGVALPAGSHAIAAFLGVIAAGHVAVPLSVDAPASYNAQVVAAAGISTVIVGDASTNFGIDIDAVHMQELVAGQTRLRPRGTPIDDPAIAYVLYTSGSTGRPKGVALTHANALFFIEWAARFFEVTAADTVAWLAPVQSDLMVFEALTSLACGAKVAVAPPGTTMLPDRLISFLRQTGVTVVEMVPTLLASVVSRSSTLLADARLRLWILAGEQLRWGIATRLLENAAGARCFNVYGMTEINDCLVYEFTDESGPPHEAVPIGVPIDGVETIVLDDTGHVVEGPGSGELLVRSPATMREYLYEPDRTLHALIPVPVGDSDSTWFRTGDHVARDADGTLTFVGRADDMVKVRGNRVHLGAIEASLAMHPAVRDCAALVIGRDADAHLVAFVTSDDLVNERDLKVHVSAKLPAYMVPKRFRVVEALPLTATGKIDRQALTREAKTELHR